MLTDLRKAAVAPRAHGENTPGVFTSTVTARVRQEAVRELSHVPQPFLDWALVESGAVNWVGSRGETVTDAAYPEDRIAPVQLGAPLGVRIAAQRGLKAGRLFKDDVPWEAGLLPGSSIIVDDDIYRLWYHGAAGLLYAQSADGITWTRPLIDFVPFESHHSTNLLPPVENVRGRRIALHDGTIFKDPNGNAEERYKALFAGSVTAEELAGFEKALGYPASATARQQKQVLFGAISPDGFSWWMAERPVMLHAGGMPATVAFDTELGRYVGYFRGQAPGRHGIARAETDDFWRWPLPLTVLAPGPSDGPGVELVNAAYAPYPGNRELRLMFPTVYDGVNDRTEVQLAMSRDGHAWHLVPGEPVIAPGEAGAFDEGSVCANGGLIYSTDQRLSLLYSGANRPRHYPRTAGHCCRPGSVQWREERLAALEAPERGEFTTVPLLLRAPRLLLNAQTERLGELRVELRDQRLRPIPGHAFADADPLTGDHLWAPATWHGDGDLSALVGQVVHLRFRMRAAKLFAIKAGE